VPRIAKYVVNLDQGGTRVCCAWDECSSPGYELHKVRQHEHARSIACDSSLGKHITFIFCSDRHKLYWLNCTGEAARVSEARNRGRVSGMLPAGYRGYMS
jgi:hypothetical protein